MSGRDGRRPFSPHLEQLIVTEVRKQQTWECFRNSQDEAVRGIGRKGFKGLAYHEAQSLDLEDGKRHSGNKNELPASKRRRKNFVLREDELAEEVAIFEEVVSLLGSPRSTNASFPDCKEMRRDEGDKATSNWVDVVHDVSTSKRKPSITVALDILVEPSFLSKLAGKVF